MNFSGLSGGSAWRHFGLFGTLLIFGSCRDPPFQVPFLLFTVTVMDSGQDNVCLVELRSSACGHFQKGLAFSQLPFSFVAQSQFEFSLYVGRIELQRGLKKNYGFVRALRTPLPEQLGERRIV